MDEKLQALIRKYKAEPNDRLLLRIGRESMRLYDVLPRDFNEIDLADEVAAERWPGPPAPPISRGDYVYKIPATLACPVCLHQMYENSERRVLTLRQDGRPEYTDAAAEVGLWLLTYHCDCTAYKVCDCKGVETRVFYATKTCEWCKRAPAVRLSGEGYALGPGALLCGVCDPG